MTINHVWHFLTRGCGSGICHIINSQTVKNHYNFTLMYYGSPVISLSLGWDIVNFQQLLRLWGKLMIKYGRPDLLVSTLLLPGQCHKDKTFILICLKAKLFHTKPHLFSERRKSNFQNGQWNYRLLFHLNKKGRIPRKDVHCNPWMQFFNENMQHLEHKQKYPSTILLLPS